MSAPFPAYVGSDPYVFVCYSHVDADVVYSDMAYLTQHGVNLWYDEGIAAGRVWRAEIAAAIRDAAQFLFYISKDSLRSAHCLSEVEYALDHGKQIIPVYLDDSLLPAELELVLNRVHALYRHDDLRYREHLLGALREEAVPPAPHHVQRGQRPRLLLALVAISMCASLLAMVMDWSGREVEKPAAVSKPEAVALYRQGQELMKRWDKGDNLDTAIALFRSASELDPEFALALARKADGLRIRYALSGEAAYLEEAQESIDEALRLNPGLAPVQVALGRIAATRGNVDIAFAAVERALEIDPHDAVANQAMAVIFNLQGRLDDAEAAFLRALSLDPDNLSIRDSYAAFLFSLSRYEDAATHWQRVIRQAPDHFVAVSNLGSCFSELGRLTEAIEMFERAIEIRPTYMSFSNLGTAYSRAGHLDAALTAYEQALAYDRKNSLAWGNLAQLYARMGDREEQSANAFTRAIELAEVARQQYTRDPFIHSDLALYYAKTGESEFALQRLQTAVTLAPESGEILAVAAETYELLGQRERALELAKKALAMGYPGQRLLYNPELTELVAVLGLDKSP